MTLLADLLHSLYFLLRGAVEAALGRRRRRYVASIDIKAPVDVVWKAVSARDIVFEGPPRIELATTPRPGTTDIFDSTMRIGERVVPLAYREVEMRPPEALLLEILDAGSVPSVMRGRDHYVACTLTPTAGGTRLAMVHDVTHDHFLSRVLIPLGAEQNARRMRDYCERQMGQRARGSRLGSAVMTGGLTYASFAYMFDWQFAAVLLVLLVIHESGHAIAMRLVGLPVQGIYFIPFFGGVAVSAAPHRSEAERGFVALMGPGFSLLTTAMFMALWSATGNPLYEQLALLSAILNGLNLAPVLPLDGGQVVDAAMSRADPGFTSIVNMLALIAGVGASVYLEWHVLTVLLLLTAPVLLRSRGAKRRAEPISDAGRNWLVAGYLATVAFYVAVAARLLA